MGILKKLIVSLKERGAKGALVRIKHRLGWEIYRLPRLAWLYIDRGFDRAYGVETSGFVHAEDADISAGLQTVARGYSPTPVPVLRSMLRTLAIDHSKYTFIDLGSGKGRALLLASEYPFKRIIGVELSQNLHKIAQNNIRIWNNSKQRCFDIESICMDARDFEFPHDPLVIFLFNPFTPPVTTRFVNKIRESLANSPRPIKILDYGGIGNYKEEFIPILAKLGLSCKEIYRRQSFSSVKGYTGRLWESEG